MINNDTPLLVEDFNDGFGDIMDEMYDFYIFGRDYYLSLREQFTADLVRDFINNEQVIVEGAFTNTIKKIIDGIIKFIKTMWRKFIGLFTKASKNVMSKVNSNDERPLIPDALKRAVEDKNIRRCEILIKDDMLLGVLIYNDVQFKHSDAMLEYCKRKIPSFIKPHDGRELDMDKSHWDKDLMSTEQVRIISNFSQERYDYLKKVMLYVTSKPNWAKEEINIISGYDYPKIISDQYWRDVERMCTELYTNTFNISDHIYGYIHSIVAKHRELEADELHVKVIDPEKISKDKWLDLKKCQDEILFSFNADKMDNISKKDIREYLFIGSRHENITFNKKYIDDSVNSLKKCITSIEKSTKTHEKNLKDIINVLEKLKNGIEKDVKSLDNYKIHNTGGFSYHDSNEKMQKIIINFLKQVQKIVNESITFETKVVQVQLSIINEGIAFIKSNS